MFSVVTAASDPRPSDRPRLPLHFRSERSGEICRPTSRQPNTTPVPSKSARPVIGVVCCRFFVSLPAQTPVYPAKIQLNSFIERNLPVSLKPARIYAEILRKSMKTRNLGGEGVPRAPILPQFGKRFHRALLTRFPSLPMVPSGALGALSGGLMRRLLIALLLCACATAQTTKPIEGPDFSRAARPRGSFYLNGVGISIWKATTTPSSPRRFRCSTASS